MRGQIPGEIKRSRDLRGGRWSWPRRDHEQGGGAGLRKLDFFCFELFFNSSATDVVLVTLPSTALETATAQCTVAAQWRGDIALTLPLFWRRSTVSPVFFRAYPRSSLHSFVLFPPPPPPPPSPSLISHLAYVDVKQNVLVCRVTDFIPHTHTGTAVSDLATQ